MIKSGESFFKKRVQLLAEKLLKEENFIESLDLYDILYQNELLQKNYPNAFIYKKKSDEIESKLLKKNEKRQLFEIEQKYQVEKKEKLIAEQNNKIAENSLYLTLLIFMLIAIVLTIILFFVRQKKKEIIATRKRQELFTFQLLQNTEEERNRIANELHDSVNHDLLNIKNTLLKGNFVEIKDVENIIEEVRNISRNLHPVVLQNIGLQAGIESLCDRLTNEAGLFVTSDIEYLQKISKPKELQLYRIIQEVLNNTLKHAKANAAKVTLVSFENMLKLEIKDNGNGFDVKEQLKNNKSFGLQSILQRAKAIDAKIVIDSSNKGTIISLKVQL